MLRILSEDWSDLCLAPSRVVRYQSNSVHGCQTEAAVSWPLYFAAADSAPTEVDVAVYCSHSAEDWAREADDDFCFNVRLHAVGATAADLEQYPAHVAASDLKVYSIWFSSLLRHRRDMAADVDLLQLAVPLPVEQHILHALVGALYSRSILLSAETVEACYRAADYLQMPCILAACVEYIHAKLLPVMPLEVHAFGRDMLAGQLQRAAEDHVINAMPWSKAYPIMIELCMDASDDHARKLLQQFQKAAVSELQMLNLVLEVRKNKPSLDFTVRLERTTLASSEDWRDACRIALLFSLTLMSGVTTVFASGHLFLS